MCFGGGQSYNPQQDVHPALYAPQDAGQQVSATESKVDAPTTYTDPADAAAPKINLTGSNTGLNTKGLM